MLSTLLFMAGVIGVGVFGFQQFQAQQANGAGELASFWIRAASFTLSLVFCLVALYRGRNQR
jgi:hypothetical protein